MKPHQPPHEVLSQKVDEGVTLSRHSILDKFLVASLSFGLLAAITTIWRDFQMGIHIPNTLINFSIIGVLCFAWFRRDRLSVAVKAMVLFGVYFLVGSKNFFLFGPIGAGIVFLGYCCMIMALVLKTKWVVIFSILISLVIPLRALLHFADIFPVEQDASLTLSLSAWITTYAYFFLTGFIIAFGVGQLRTELNKNFVLLRQAVDDLRSVNKQLRREIGQKNIYEEELLISNRKFQGLFEGSRDGVLLLNSKAKIIEANAAAIEMSGYSLGELKSINVFDLAEESYREETIERFTKSMQGELQPVMLEVEFCRKDGTVVPVEINSNLILADDELMVLSTVRDISYRKVAENEKFNAALAGEERERERFSKDLHDDLGPVFSTLNLYLQTLSSKETDVSKKEILNNLSGIVDSAVKQVREISHNLSPYLLRDAGLVEAIRTHLKKFETNGIDAQLEVHADEVSKIPQSTQTALYRVFLELLNNTLKHSAASTIRIQLSQSVKELIFSYTDNGKGFDPRQPANSGIGLRNIENRVKALNGAVKFQNELNAMTTIVKIPR